MMSAKSFTSSLMNGIIWARNPKVKVPAAMSASAMYRMRMNLLKIQQKVKKHKGYRARYLFFSSIIKV